MPALRFVAVVLEGLAKFLYLWSLSCSLLDFGSMLASKYLEGLVSKLKSGRGLF
jgi:hypothetical protein